MKRTLLGSTAIVAVTLVALPAMAQDSDVGKIKLGVGGYHHSVFSYTDQDNIGTASFNEFTVRQEGEIHFDGSMVLDDGIKVGFRAELEAITQDDQIDKTFAYFEGNFGRFEIGSINGAADKMSYAAPSAGFGVNSPAFFLFQARETKQGSGDATNNVATGGFLGFTGDANKLNYFTPRFSGVQLGISYVPNNDVSGGDRQNGGLNQDNEAGKYKNLWSFGANFVRDFDQAAVSIYGGYEFGAREAQGTATDYTNFKDHKAWGFGGQVTFSNFTVGGSYTEKDFDDADPGNVTKGDYSFYDLGVTYGMGPWNVGLAWGHADQDLNRGPGTVKATGKKNKRDLLELGGNYQLSQGVLMTGAIQHVKEKSGYTGQGGTINGWALALGTTLTF